jgi:hypothetical protein
MKTFDTLKETREAGYHTIADRYAAMVSDYCKEQEIDGETEPLDFLFGGQINIVESEEELNEMIRDFGDMPDVVDPTVDNFVIVSYLTNNAGGDSQVIPVDLYNTWLPKQTDALQKNYAEVTFK